MAYISAIAIDFGSSNTGVARIDHFENGKLTYTTPTLPCSDGHYAKDTTWFFISPLFLMKCESNWDSLTDADFKILSRINKTTEHPNVIWGRDFIKEKAELIESEGWIDFKYFKMMIYKNLPYKTNGKEYSIEFVVKLFLRIIKVDCLSMESANAKCQVTTDQVQWGITIPSIWTVENKKMMSCICSEIFGEHARVLSEPEGPVIAERLHSGAGTFKTNPGHKSLVVDSGGGTTDLCLLEDEISEENELKFKLLASSDGIGLGGNNIDDAFKDYLLRFISKDLKSDSGINYNELSDQELQKMLLEPYLQGSLAKAIDFENGWLNYKHGLDASYRIPKDYRLWLMEKGHHKIADRISDILIGDIDFGGEEMRKAIFEPVFSKITQTVYEFLVKHKDLVGNDAKTNFSFVFAGGLSLSHELRDSIKAAIRKATCCEYNEANLAYLSNSVSASIMEGASYVLLCRHSIRRKAKFYIFDMFTKIPLSNMVKYYAELGVKMSMGTLDSIADRDVEEYGAMRNYSAVPVAIKDQYFKDYETDFFAKNADNREIKTVFYKSDEIIVCPYNNSHVEEIEDFTIDNDCKEGYHCIVDFNESEIGHSMHYYVTRKDTGELITEKSVIL